MPVVRRFDRAKSPPPDSLVKAFNVRLVDADSSGPWLRFSGWAVARDQAVLEIVLRDGDWSKAYPLDKPRPDIVAFVGGGTPEICGFEFAYAPQGDVVTVDVHVDGQDIRLAEVELEPWQPPEIASAAPEPVAEAATPPPLMEARDVISPKAVRGRNDFLFVGGFDSNNLMNHMTGASMLTAAALEIHRQNFARLKTLPCPHLVVIVPEAHVLYEENLPEGMTLSPDRPVSALLREFGDDIYYPRQDLLRLKAEGGVVYTGHDSHWTEMAALEVYGHMRRRLGRDFPMAGTYTPNLAREVRDLRVSTPEEAREREAEARKHPHGSYLCYFANSILNHGNLSALYNAKGQGRCLAFGTSFSTRLSPAYANDFQEVLLCYGTTADPLMVELYKPDVVIVEMPERFVHFPASTVAGGLLLSSLIISRTSDFNGPAIDRLAAMPLPVSDAVLIARDLLLSGREPEREAAALDRLAVYSSEVADKAHAIAGIAHNITVPNVLRAVVSGQFTNKAVIQAMLSMIQRGELDGAPADIFPPTESGLASRAQLALRNGRPDEAEAALAHYVSVYGNTEYSGWIAADLAQSSSRRDSASASSV